MTSLSRRAPAILVALTAFAAAAADSPKQLSLDEALRRLRKYDYGQARNSLNATEAEIAATHKNVARRQALEKRLATVVSGDATFAAKEFACRKLSLIGSAECVPAVAGLLADKQLSHMARFVLGRVRDPAAAAAMRDAMQDAPSEVKVGIINSLGARRDREATAALMQVLNSPDKEVAKAAAIALARIGTPETAKALLAFRERASGDLKLHASHASLKAAEGIAENGQIDMAASVYERLYSADGPETIHRAALKGLVTARPTESTPLLMKALAGDDRQLRALAAQLVRDLPGSKAVPTFASNLPKLPPAAQIALLTAFGERGDAAAHSAVIGAMTSDDRAVRTVAFNALITVGGPADVSMLADMAAAKSPDRSLAQRTLSRLVGEGVDKAIVTAIGGAKPTVRVELIRSLGNRYTKESLPVLLESATDPDGAIRRAALEAVGMLADGRHVATLVGAVKAAKSSSERRSADKALSATCGRSREKCAGPVIAGIDGTDDASHCVLLRALGKARGPSALDAIRKAVREGKGEVKTTAVRVLSEWPDEKAAPDLLDIAKSTEDLPHHVLALRGYIRIIDSSRKKSEEKLAALKSALALARRPDEKKQVLGALRDIRTLPALQLATQCLADKALCEEAASAAISIADRLKVKKPEERKAVAAAMEKAIQVAANEKARKTAEKVLGRYKK